MVEGEPRKFRLGESSGRPIGGNVSSEPFAQALYKLAASRGYESQLLLGKVFGHRSNSPVGKWYRSTTVPSPEYFGALLMLFKPNDEELESLVEPYGKLLAEGKGNTVSEANTPRAVKAGRNRIRPSGYPLGSWMENYCQENGISLKSLRARLLLTNTSKRDGYGLETMSDILQRASEVLGLSSEQTESLAEAVAETIEEKVVEGHKFRSNLFGGRIRKIQQELQCVTFNSSQVAEILGTSPQFISLLRRKMELPMLMTEADVARMALRLEGTKEMREKTQAYYRNRRLQESR